MTKTASAVTLELTSANSMWSAVTAAPAASSAGRSETSICARGGIGDGGGSVAEAGDGGGGEPPELTSPEPGEGGESPEPASLGPSGSGDESGRGEGGRGEGGGCGGAGAFGGEMG